MHRPLDQWSGLRIGDGITLGVILGRGGSGVVYQARQRDGELVAVKLMSPGNDTEQGRMAREIAALECLQRPGVVQLIDEGIHEGCPFIVMSLVAGSPFPGPRGHGVHPGRWDAIADTVQALLEILGGVHDAGLVHRDIKPGNVLVDAEGWPTLIDFGVARPMGSGYTVTREGMLVGTPLYLSPEQIIGGEITHLADLYAVGVMLYEHLAGRPPVGGDDMQLLMRRKLVTAPEPLHSVAPHVPLHVCQVIDALLSIKTDDRPRSAADTLARLQRGAALGETLPPLGDGRTIEALVQGGLSGKAMDLSGPSGCGLTWTLERAAERLEAQGRVVHWLPAGRGPLESLTPIIDPSVLEDPALLSAGLNAMLDRVDTLIEDLLAAGTVLIADRADQLDRWSANCLQRIRDKGAVFRVVAESHPADLILSPLDAADLSPLFAGPDRLLHLVEDGVRTLFNRTGGLPRHITTEVITWLSAGLATWRDDQLHIGRDALIRLDQRPLARQAKGAQTALQALSNQPGLEDRLAWVSLAWPHTTVAELAAFTQVPLWTLQMEIEALTELGAVHTLMDGRVEPRIPARALQRWSPNTRLSARRTVVDALSPGAEGRLSQAIALGDGPLVAREGVARASRLLEAGNQESALQVQIMALEALTPTGRPSPLSHAQLSPLLHSLTLTALSSPTSQARATTIDALGRCTHNPEAERLVQLLETFEAVAGQDPATAQAAVDALAPFDDLELEWRRHEARFRLATRQGAQHVSECLTALAEQARTAPQHLQGLYATWCGIAAYQRGDYAKAASHHAEAAEKRLKITERLPSRINVALNHLESARYGDARATALEIKAEAEAHRLTSSEAYAEYILRDVDIRQGLARRVDLELIEAAEQMGTPDQLLGMLVQEGVLALRLGEAELAERLSRRILHITGGQGPVGLIGEALTYAASSDPPLDADAISAKVQQVRSQLPLTLAIQVLGLFAHKRGAHGEGSWHDAVASLVELVPERLRTVHHGIMSPLEALTGFVGSPESSCDVDSPSTP
ncbi:MAG: serine/threonine-protein kinase [Bradymonadia bacterium]